MKWCNSVVLIYELLVLLWAAQNYEYVKLAVTTHFVEDTCQVLSHTTPRLPGENVVELTTSRS